MKETLLKGNFTPISVLVGLLLGIGYSSLGFSVFLMIQTLFPLVQMFDSFQTTVIASVCSFIVGLILLSLGYLLIYILKLEGDYTIPTNSGGDMN